MSEEAKPTLEDVIMERNVLLGTLHRLLVSLRAVQPDEEYQNTVLSMIEDACTFGVAVGLNGGQGPDQENTESMAVLRLELATRFKSSFEGEATH